MLRLCARFDKQADLSTDEKHTPILTTFDEGVRMAVKKYFDTYKTHRHGLPPTCVSRINAREITVAWDATTLGPGVFITERARPYLVEVPSALVRALPAPPSDIRYYMAGCDVVAVDSIQDRRFHSGSLNQDQLGRLTSRA
jgi:hypothetical protein